MSTKRVNLADRQQAIELLKELYGHIERPKFDDSKEISENVIQSTSQD